MTPVQPKFHNTTPQPHARSSHLHDCRPSPKSRSGQPGHPGCRFMKHLSGWYSRGDGRAGVSRTRMPNPPRFGGLVYEAVLALRWDSSSHCLGWDSDKCGNAVRSHTSFGGLVLLPSPIFNTLDPEFGIKWTAIGVKHRMHRFDLFTRCFFYLSFVYRPSKISNDRLYTHTNQYKPGVCDDRYLWSSIHYF
ncbi:hypothetical protein BDV96DRAFT_205834 [Lophiotrema nucula]|uniref:Uncharacterized protein n=1 Tax=Lophiotrema nucula TaxID=690887 RepID=A0A6A5ZNE7_9PLEO|nr:hypothetical protein BDV96DRAFT_205834 [Lophiotrema nucula]